MFQPAAPVDSRTKDAHSFLDFYPILSYVELMLVEPKALSGNLPGTSGAPLVLTRQSIQDSWNKRSESIRKIFEWLKKQKQVRRILKLVVIDDEALPCSDSTFEDCLRDFDIRYLNWNKEDLCTDTLRNAGLSNMKELWLSWSGRNSVLHSWSCKESGLAKFSQVWRINHFLFLELMAIPPPPPNSHPLQCLCISYKRTPFSPTCTVNLLLLVSRSFSSISGGLYLLVS